MSRIISEEERNMQILLGLFIFILMCGVALGSAYMIKHNSSYEGLTEYLTEYLKNTVSNVNKREVIKNALKSNMIMLGVIFFAAFFKIGFLVAGACLLRKGFVVGFTAASFMEAFGLKGVVVSLSYLPGFVLIIPAFVLFCSISSAISLKKEKFQRKIIFSYIFFTIFIITIFCAASFFEGYLTTIFMTKFAQFI